MTYAAGRSVSSSSEVWDQSAPIYRSPPLNLPMGSLTSRAHVCLTPVQTATAVLPVPRSTEGRFVPISARGE